MNKPTIIEVSHLSKKYEISNNQLPYRLLRDEISDWFRFKKNTQSVKSKSFWALKNVSFLVRAGEAIGIIGPNGAGKSTLLKILSQITSPTSGQVILHGRAASLLEVGTGFSPELTGRENIYLNGAILGMSKKEINRKLSEIINFAEIGQFIDVPVKRYSSGMYVRLAFSIAAHLEPEILIIDEVLAVGDARFQRKSLGKMDDVARKRGRTVLFVSHDLGAVRRLCPHAMLIDKGRLVTFGPSSKVIGKYLGEVNKNVPHADQKIPVTNRSGTGDIRITGVHINPSPAVSGSNIRFIFDYRSIKECREAKLSFNVSTELGQSLFLQQSIYDDKLFEISKGKGQIICDIPKLPLISGTYLVNLRVEANGCEADYPRDPVLKFEVVYGDYYGNGIVPMIHSSFLVGGEWKLI